MKYSLATAAFAALTSFASARKCQNITIPVSISARNGNFNISAPANNIEVTNFILNLARQGHNYTNEILNGYKTVSGNYNIAATYCEPDAGPAKVVQVLTHGIGFDKSYWDLSANNYNYSYVAQAVDHYGYSTFAYDRLGIGMSSRGEPVNEIQLWLEVAALKSLTSSLRTGGIKGISAKYGKVVHVGHSFGSAQTYTLTAQDPSWSDGIALTGFSQNGTFAAYFEYGGNFVLTDGVPALSNYPHGYLAAGDVSAVQTNFFSPGMFDPAILQLAYMTGQPVTEGEILTLAGATAKPNTFAGPVLVVTGGRDLPYCGGDCLATGNPALASIPAASKMYFPNAAAFEAFIVPNAGHGLNLEYSHPLTYTTILNFFESHGLGPNAAGSSSAGSSATGTATASSSTASSSSWKAWKA